ncbi:MAG: ester cyclase [Mycobacterium sp.]
MDENGKERSASFSSEKTAKQHLKSVARGEVANAHGRKTFEEFYKGWSTSQPWVPGTVRAMDLAAYSVTARVIGIREYRQMMEVAYASIPDFHTVVHDQIATDERVVARWTTSGTHTGDSLGAPATGKPIEFSDLSVWEFEDGKARRGWIYSNLPIVLMQISAP